MDGAATDTVISSSWTSDVGVGTRIVLDSATVEGKEGGGGIDVVGRSTVVACLTVAGAINFEGNPFRTGGAGKVGSLLVDGRSVGGSGTTGCASTTFPSAPPSSFLTARGPNADGKHRRGRGGDGESDIRTNLGAINN